MKLSMMIVTIVVMTLLSFESGCSWIKWNHIPKPSAPLEKIECGKGGPVTDTIVAGLAAIGTGTLFGTAFGGDLGQGCGHDDSGTCAAAGYAASLAGGIIFAVITVVYGAAAITGWVNYNNCREYQERVSALEQLSTGPELFHTSSPNPETPNPSSPPTDKLDGESK